jgi:hypothetical protein
MVRYLVKHRCSRVDIAGFEAFTAVKIQVEVFWVMTPCSVAVRYPFQRSVVQEDGGNMDL